MRKSGLIIGGICLLVINILTARAQDVEPSADAYIASTIPDSLKENANSVLRFESIEIDNEAPGKRVLTEHRIITILNEKANEYAGIRLGYNKKFSTIGSFEMKVYDAEGKQVKRYRKSDMYDHAVEDDGAIVTDDRELAIYHTIASYPATVEITFEEDATSAIDLGDWKIMSPEQSVQAAFYTVSVPDSVGFRYLCKNIKLAPQINGSGGTMRYAWQVYNLKAFKPEEGAMPWRVLPSVSFMANKFKYYDMPGDIGTWQAFGKWVWNLNSDGASLTEAREREIQAMTDSIKTDKDKARFLYHYMQQSMRYVDVTLGIGGLKPFSATFVDQKKYGDCKALSNYMCALLKAVGIKSYYAIVNAGPNEEPANATFPENDFDHVILCVPFKNDTTWLECTSNTQPFGKLGSFTENRNALLITENGGKLVNTPRSTPNENQFISNAHLVLDEDGGAKADVAISSTGDIRDIFVDELPQLNADKQKEAILREFDIKQPVSFDYEPGQDNKGTKQVNLKFDFDKFCDIKAGDKIFYHPYALNFWDISVPEMEKRRTDYYFDFPFQGTSTTTLDLPAGFEVESLPANQDIKFSYGDFDAKYTYDAAKNQVISIYKFNLNSQVIPAAKYTEMQEYLDAVIKAQNKKLVIKRKA